MSRFLNRLVQRLDALTLRILDPATRIDPFKSLAVANVLLGLAVLFFAAGVPQEIYEETGVPRFWYPVLCFVCAALWRWRLPSVYLTMLLPIGFYTVGSAYIAYLRGNWPDVLIPAVLYYQFLRRWSDVKNHHNGLTHD